MSCIIIHIFLSLSVFSLPFIRYSRYKKSKTSLFTQAAPLLPHILACNLHMSRLPHDLVFLRFLSDSYRPRGLARLEAIYRVSLLSYLNDHSLDGPLAGRSEVVLVTKGREPGCRHVDVA